MDQVQVDSMSRFHVGDRVRLVDGFMHWRVLTRFWDDDHQCISYTIKGSRGMPMTCTEASLVAAPDELLSAPDTSGPLDRPGAMPGARS